MKILLNGICGRMGAEVAKLIEEGCRNSELCAGVDIGDYSGNVPFFHKLDDVDVKADVIIDFSHHSTTKKLCEYAVKTNTPVIIATTGQTTEELEVIKETSKKIPVFKSANMSLGVSLLIELAKTTAKAMPDAEIEIIEKHHDRKVDAPSGTALLIANAIKSVRDKAFFVFGRSGQSKRTKNEIGIHAIRMGNIVGEHEVIVGTDSQIITLKHEAKSRSLFAEGSLAAAEFICGKKPGLYDMQSMIND